MRVDEIKLQLVLPSSEIRIVLAQPNVKLSAREPFKRPNSELEQQITEIETCLSVSNLDETAHFTIFPEYTIPGLEGVQAIDSAVTGETWDRDTVVIGGLHALTVGEYTELCNMENTDYGESVGPENIPPELWINCSITWIKESNGEVRKWIQPKLVPNHVEENRPTAQMFKGDSVNVFVGSFDNGPPCRFLSLICYDWVGFVEGDRVLAVDLVLQELGRNSEHVKVVDWLFVLQFNEKPNHASFLDQTNRLLNERQISPWVDLTSRTCIVFANTTNLVSAGRSNLWAHSSVVMSPGAPVVFESEVSLPSISSQPKLLRDIANLDRCKDVLFREMGPCIHDFLLHVLQFAGGAGVAHRSGPVKNVCVHPLDTMDAQRFPGEPVEAIVKWVCDELDGQVSNRVSTRYDKNIPCVNDLKLAEDKTANIVRPLSPTWLRSIVNVAEAESPEENVDKWAAKESKTFQTVMDILAAFELCSNVDMTHEGKLGFVELAGWLTELVVVNGKSSGDCIGHFDKNHDKSSNGFILVITRDEDNLNRENARRLNSSFLKSFGEVDPDKGPIFTKPSTRVIYGCYQDILGFLIGANTPAELYELINDYVH